MRRSLDDSASGAYGAALPGELRRKGAAVRRMCLLVGIAVLLIGVLPVGHASAATPVASFGVSGSAVTTCPATDSGFCLPGSTPFYVDLSNGTYNVSVLMGDAVQKTGMAVRGSPLVSSSSR